MTTKMLAFALTSAALLSGCSGMSGLDANSDFSCKAPDGVLCESMSGIYANAQAKNLPGQRVNQRSTVALSPEVSNAKGVITRPINSGTPIRSAPRILRLWLSPWEDSDGDLHDQSYVYLAVDSGRWLVEHNRRRIQDAYRPVRAPASVAAPQAAAEASRQGGSYGAAGQGATQGDGVVIGARQDRMPSTQAAQYLNGMLTPSGVLQESE